MAVITRLFFRGTDETIVRRAPSGKVYLVEAINLIFQQAANNSVYILDRFLKPNSNPVMGPISSQLTPTLLALFRNGGTTNTATALFVNNINHRTKYISVAYENANSTNFGAVVYGEIVSETKSNLIWEFITKRHR